MSNYVVEIKDLETDEDVQEFEVGASDEVSACITALKDHYKWDDDWDPNDKEKFLNEIGVCQTGEDLEEIAGEWCMEISAALFNKS